MIRGSPANRKYGAKKVLLDGNLFDSIKEARRYIELDALQEAGEISFLELQPKFVIDIKGRRVCTYTADFRYRLPDGSVVVEDVKGVKTPVYRLKKKLMAALHGIEIQET